MQKRVKTISYEYLLIIQSGIDLNDCEKVNDGIMDLLDEADYIKEQYFLEVSSPGIERTLRKEKHLNENLGSEVEASLFKPLDKEKKIIGVLKEFDEKFITILRENEEIKIERKNISLLKTIYNWN